MKLKKHHAKYTKTETDMQFILTNYSLYLESFRYKL